MKIYLLIIGMLFTVFSQAQSKTGVLSGSVKSSDNQENLVYTKVYLLDGKDSSIITGGITKEDGAFRIDAIPFGTYLLKVSAFGYNSFFKDGITLSPKQSNLDLGSILLDKNDQLLNEVEVVHEKEAIQMQIDRKVFNVEKQITATGGTALDALENIPSVTVDMDGNVSLRGSANVTILIDGKPSSITGGGRQGILTGIPASAIETIEVITNPSAKYDPDGMSGIINIVLKKNKLKGFNGNIDLSIENGIHWDSIDTYTNMFGFNDNLAGNLAYRNEFFNIYGGYSTNHYEGYRNNYNSSENWYDGQYKIVQDRQGTHWKLNHTFKGGMDFYIKKNHTAGFSFNGNFSKEDRTGNQWYEETIDDTLRNKWLRVSHDPEKRQGLDGMVYYSAKGKKEGQSFDFSAQYSAGNGIETGNYYQNDYDAGTGELIAEHTLDQYAISGTGSNISTIQADYYHPIKKGKLETGAKSTFRDLRESYYQETDGVIDAGLVNRFSYNEQVHAVYGIFGQDYEKFKFQVGMRLEQVFVLGQLDNDPTDYHNNYFSFYPSVHMVKPLKENAEFSLSYSRRVNRPGTGQLNPFARYSDPFNLRKGNPELNPEYINSVEFGYAKYGKILTLTTSAYYRYMTNMIQRIVSVDTNGVSVTQYQNLDQGHFIGMEAVANVKVTKWWKVMLTGNVSQNYLKSTSGDADLNNSGITWSTRMQSTMTFKKVWTVQMTGYYRSPMVFAQGSSIPMYGMDLAAKYSFFKDKMYLNLKITDVFNTKRFGYSTSSAGEFQNSGYFKHQSRRFMLTFGYRFGNQDQEKRKRNFGSGEGGGDFD
ncbi:MAG: TonB-dependent receptor [Crocinitomicaceae bacterium]|nr:TonB-dependent receptor [Crocinitomicaceae bacterium]